VLQEQAFKDLRVETLNNQLSGIGVVAVEVEPEALVLMHQVFLMVVLVLLRQSQVRQ
jgi:hypothetical protein